MSRFSVDSSSEPESDSDYEFDDEATFDVDLKTIEHASAGTFALVAQMLEVHPSERISAENALASINRIIEKLSDE